MKNKLAQLYVLVSSMSPRYIQYASFAFMLAAFFMQSPSDGGATGR